MEEILRDQAREINRKLPQSQHVVGPNKQDCGLLGDTMIHTLLGIEHSYGKLPIVFVDVSLSRMTILHKYV